MKQEVITKIKNKINIIQLLKDHNPFNPHNAINIYMYGSSVYGTFGPKSDTDVIMVSNIEEPFIQFNNNRLSCIVYNIDEFNIKRDEHEISILECLYLPSQFKIKENYSFTKDFNIDKSKLRHSISSKASNSFVKAKKKLIVEEDKDVYVAKKSLFHSLRIPIFGKQIAESGSIIDYSAANHYWNDIKLYETDDWDFYKKTYQPIFNSLMSEFRKVAPKQEI